MILNTAYNTIQYFESLMSEENNHTNSIDLQNPIQTIQVMAHNSPEIFMNPDLPQGLANEIKNTYDKESTGMNYFSGFRVS